MSQQINLFNPAFVKRRDYFLLPNILQALGLIVAGALLFYGYATYRNGELRKQSDESAKRYNAEQARLARYAAELSPRQSGPALQEEVRGLEKQVAEQAELIEAVKSGAVGNTVGYSEYLRAFARQGVQGLWLTGFKVTGDAVQISLSGGALSPELLPAYIRRLGGESIMRGKAFTALQMRQPKAGTGQSAAPRHIEFTLHSGPDGETKK